MTDIGTGRVFRIDPTALDLREEHGRATFLAFGQPRSTLMVSVEGDVDATNDRALARYVESRIAGQARMELDLRLVDYFGTAGFAALHNINVTCYRNQVPWRLLAGRQVRRLLSICDPAGILPLDWSLSVLDQVDTSARDREFLIGRHN